VLEFLKKFFFLKVADHRVFTLFIPFQHKRLGETGQFDKSGHCAPLQTEIHEMPG
jgi:hypothetical protein